MSRKDTILGIDTSGTECCAALLQDRDVVAEKIERLARGHSERLFPILFELLSDSKLSWQSLKAIAVITGPGNHTGIRLAISAARGLSLALQVPSIGVSSFEAAAHGIEGTSLVLISGLRQRVHSKFMPTGEPEFKELGELTRPPTGFRVIAQEFARDIAVSWGCTWQAPLWNSAEAAARIADRTKLSCAERPMPFNQLLLHQRLEPKPSEITP